MNNINFNGFVTTPTENEFKKFSNLTREEVKILLKVYNKLKKIKADLDPKAIDQTSILYTYKNNINNMCNSIEDILANIIYALKPGQWLLQIKGVDLPTAAALLAYFDVTNKECAAQFINFAGLNRGSRPTLTQNNCRQILNKILGVDEYYGNIKREISYDEMKLFAQETKWPLEYLAPRVINNNGKILYGDLIKVASRLPYCDEVRKIIYELCLKFKSLGYESTYGSIYLKYLEAEIKANGGNSKNKFETDLPYAQIDDRAMLKTGKVFVSHLFEEMYRSAYGKLPPRYNNDKINIEPEVPYIY